MPKGDKLYLLNNEENLSQYPVGREQLLSMLGDSFQHIAARLGPFRDDEMIVTLKSAGGGGANPGSFSITPLIISEHSAVESLYSFILHEMTHVLTYQWGESFLPLFSEGIAYLIGGIYIEAKYSNDFHVFANAYLETTEIRLAELLDPQSYFVAKESFGYVSKVSASFTDYLIGEYGLDSIRTAFEYGKEIDCEKARYSRAKKHRANCLDRWLSDLGKQSLPELEHEYLGHIGKAAATISNSQFDERRDKDLIRREYPFWHCHKCWRPNIKESDRCSHCRTRRQEMNEFGKTMQRTGRLKHGD